MLGLLLRAVYIHIMSITQLLLSGSSIHYRALGILFGVTLWDSKYKPQKRTIYNGAYG